MVVTLFGLPPGMSVGSPDWSPRDGEGLPSCSRGGSMQPVTMDIKFHLLSVTLTKAQSACIGHFLNGYSMQFVCNRA